MEGYKHIEHLIGTYLGARYKDVVEVGIGQNTVAAEVIRDADVRVRCTDVHPLDPPAGIDFTLDDIFGPDLSFYWGADLIYAIRPGVEMIPSLIALATELDADLVVYHLGDEVYLDGGVTIDCGVRLHQYRVSSEQSGLMD
ncbi:UPF0146 family protein [Methanosphaerula palustris]|uniref:UPF0146 protein Mpal_1752 n=1 Tax=Methanosphaerula palustris (strain ATCC BAA-1556 / DSM 19958 / E1-9c) TaxID=521011 RepID=B8GJY8_METPE|nr:UPF0146 family protein [Methanosphaerula palustris]ACL17059.1 Protein of unknown function UPF0146 [Methanosphaerula palustris E1-9c]